MVHGVKDEDNEDKGDSDSNDGNDEKIKLASKSLLLKVEVKKQITSHCFCTLFISISG